MKYVIVIEDGASDYPIEEIDGKTPLKIADKPVLSIHISRRLRISFFRILCSLS